MDREPACCNKCSHNGVCKYMNDYADMTDALMSTYEKFTTIEGKAFMEFHDPICKYYNEKKVTIPGVNYRPREMSDQVKETIRRMEDTM